MKAFITHCTSAVRAWKLAAIAGSATFSTEPSIKLRLEARMQVARTRRGLAHATPSPPAGARAGAFSAPLPVPADPRA